MNSTFSKIADLNHELNRVRGIDRTTLFGRLEILEYYCEKEHKVINEGWRKFGRYGNIVTPAAMLAALKTMKDELQFTKEEMSELCVWLKGQAKMYCSPDQAVAGVIFDMFIKQNY